MSLAQAAQKHDFQLLLAYLELVKAFKKFKETSVTSPNTTNVAVRPSSATARILAGKRALAAALLFTILVLSLPALVQAQTYVYANNQDVANSVAGFSVSSTGALSPVPGSPYATGGVGLTVTCQGLDRIITSAANNLLFVSNSGDQTISAFQINAADGSLTAAPGSPFASLLTLDRCQGISLAVTPDGGTLMASSGGQIQSFSVAANGALTAGPSTANCCSPTVGMKISAHGQLLALSNENSVSVYSINADGSLTAAAGSPFPITGSGLLSAVDFSCAGDRLYGSEASFSNSTITDAWTVNAGGSLAPLAASPFLGAGSDSTSVVLSPDNTRLFTNDLFSNKINSFKVNADGSLSSIGGFGAPTNIHVPSGLAANSDGTFLFAADDSWGVAVFKINGTGSLTSVSDTAIDRVGSVQSVAAYPPRSCVSGDLALTMTADATTVDSGSNVTYTITITNNGTAPASATIVDNLPAGESFVSCTADGGGVCSLTLPNPHTVVFTGIAAGATQTISLVAATDVNLLNGAVLANTAFIGNKSIIDTNAANDSVTANITMSAKPGPTTLTVSPASGSFGGQATLIATLQKKSNGALISGKSISFTLNGSPAGTAITNNAGQAFLTVNVSSMALGTYPGAIGASFAGDAIFNPSTGAGDLIVNKAVLTIVAANATKIYQDPNPVFTYSLTGFLNSDTAAVVSGSTTCNTTIPTDNTTPVGTYTIHCPVGSLSAANYTFASFDGVFSVTKPPLKVVVNNATRLYGDPDPSFSGTITGLRGTDVITANYTTTATAASPVGTYAIMANLVDPGGVLGNYDVTISQGTLTITPAPLTVNTDNISRFYGDANPVLTGTILGIKNGDAITATYATTATPASGVGTYPITAALVDPTGKLANYIVTINNGTLTVTPAPLVVTAASVSRLYGDPNPAFTGTIVGIKNADPITATYASAATVTSDVGTYAIIPTLVDPSAKLVNYAVTVVNGVLTINPAPLTFTVANATRVYGDANPAFSGSFVGIKNGDVLSVAYTTPATAASPVGTYPITPVVTGAKVADYTIIVNGGVLTITKAPLSVVAPAGASTLYGDAIPLPTITGIKNGDAISASYTSPTNTSPVGSYTLVPVLSDPANKLGNYTVTITNGKVTINKAPLSVVANSASRAFGGANSTLSGTITGVKNGENITATFTTNPALTATSNVGSYVITAAAVFNPSTLSGNYTLSTTNGTFTITAVPLTITANNQTIILGGTVAASAAYSGFVAGQTPANLSGTLNCSATRGTGNVGTSPISCSGQSSTNYAITFVAGTATIQYEPAGVNCTAGPGHAILAPISAAGTTAFTKATTPTVAVQFRVCGVNLASVSSAGVATLSLVSVNGNAASTPAPAGSFAFVGGTLANGAGTQGWQLNLSTSNLTAGNTYGYKINLNDGTSISFQFKLQ